MSAEEVWSKSAGASRRQSGAWRKGQRQSLCLRLLADLVLRLVLMSTSENLFSLEEAWECAAGCESWKTRHQG